jgi:hypothetical protein
MGRCRRKPHTHSRLCYSLCSTKVCLRHGLESTSIANTLAGDVSKEPTRKQERVSRSAVLVLVDGLLRNATLYGTAPWDLTIAKAMSLVVDLVIKVVDDAKGLRLRALLTLRYVKGHRYVSTLDKMNNSVTSTTEKMVRRITLPFTNAIAPSLSSIMINVHSLTAAKGCMYILSQCTVLL